MVGRTLLIPRPFGPRMRPADTVTVVRAAARTAGIGWMTAGVSEDWLRKRKLDELAIWMRPEQRVLRDRGNETIRLEDTLFPGILRLDDLVDIFLDGFPRENRSDVKKKIEKANRDAFAGSEKELKKGWRRLIIPEKTVDLFEAYTQAVIEALGLPSERHWRPSGREGL